MLFLFEPQGWDWGLEARLGALGLEFKPPGWYFILEAGIRGWYLSLGAEIGASKLELGGLMLEFGTRDWN